MFYKGVSLCCHSMNRRFCKECADPHEKESGCIICGTPTQTRVERLTDGGGGIACLRQPGWLLCSNACAHLLKINKGVIRVSLEGAINGPNA